MPFDIDLHRDGPIAIGDQLVEAARLNLDHAAARALAHEAGLGDVVVSRHVPVFMELHHAVAIRYGQLVRLDPRALLLKGEVILQFPVGRLGRFDRDDALHALQGKGMYRVKADIGADIQDEIGPEPFGEEPEEPDLGLLAIEGQVQPALRCLPEPTVN